MLDFFKKVLLFFESLIFKKRDDEIIVEQLLFNEGELKRAYLNLKGISPILLYKDPKVKSLIWEIKYHRNPKAIKIGALLLFEAIKEDILEKELFEKNKYTIVNIPTSKNKFINKGFCHTNLLCLEIEKLIKNDEFLSTIISYDQNILEKIKDTKPQSHTESRDQRLKNLSRCFKIKNFTENHIILIDDVVTTGTTIEEAVKTLNKSGINKISCYTLSH